MLTDREWQMQMRMRDADAVSDVNKLDSLKQK